MKVFFEKRMNTKHSYILWFSKKLLTCSVHAQLWHKYETLHTNFWNNSNNHSTEKSISYDIAIIINVNVWLCANHQVLCFFPGIFAVTLWSFIMYFQRRKNNLSVLEKYFLCKKIIFLKKRSLKAGGFIVHS